VVRVGSMITAKTAFSGSMFAVFHMETYFCCVIAGLINTIFSFFIDPGYISDDFRLLHEAKEFAMTGYIKLSCPEWIIGCQGENKI
jgi:hypothetical protein